MKLGILNEELGILMIESSDDLGQIQSEQIKKQMPEGVNLKDLAFFYMPKRDWVVINKDHELYGYYSEIIPVYLELSEKSRKECIEEAPTATLKCAFRILDGVIRDRVLINSLFSRKAV